MRVLSPNLVGRSRPRANGCSTAAISVSGCVSAPARRLGTRWAGAARRYASRILMTPRAPAGERSPVRATAASGGAVARCRRWRIPRRVECGMTPLRNRSRATVLDPTHESSAPRWGLRTSAPLWPGCIRHTHANASCSRSHAESILRYEHADGNDPRAGRAAFDGAAPHSTPTRLAHASSHHRWLVTGRAEQIRRAGHPRARAASNRGLNPRSCPASWSPESGIGRWRPNSASAR